MKAHPLCFTPQMSYAQIVTNLENNEHSTFLFQLLKRNASLRFGAGPGDAAEIQVNAFIKVK